MNPIQLQALQRYVSAVCWFMMRHDGDDGLRELFASKAHLEAVFGKALPAPAPAPAKPDFPDIL